MTPRASSYLLPLLCCIASLACGANTTGPDAGGSTDAATSSAAQRPAVDVQLFGALWALKGGAGGPQVVLSRALRGPHTYAVGVLSEQRGEVTVLNGEVWIAYASPGRAARAQPSRRSDEHAALLVTASVDRWREVSLRTAIDPAELDRRIEELAAAAGLELDRPFPVLVEGRFTQLRWSARPGGKPTALAEAKGTLVGFFSRRHRGVFTQPSSTTHLHVVVPMLGVSGHVERVTVEPGATVRFPAG